MAEFELSAGNIVVGRFTFAFITMPEGWVVKIGDSPPDVYYTTDSQHPGWVLEGEGRYLAVNLVGGQALELDVRCKASKDFSPKLGQYSTIYAGGHRSYFVIKSVKAGLLKKRELTQLTVFIPCSVTGRVLEFTFTGDGDWVGDILQNVSAYRCHPK